MVRLINFASLLSATTAGLGMAIQHRVKHADKASALFDEAPDGTWVPTASMQTATESPQLTGTTYGDHLVADSIMEPVFLDVTSTAFPPEWYAWNHVGRPRNYCGTPVFPDFNGDGVLDFFYHNHYQLNPATDWDLGLSYGSNTGKSEQPWYKSVANTTLVCTEEEESEYHRTEMDTHSTVFLDIDRDGFKDMFISVGGGKGLDSGRDKNAVLMWGEEGGDAAVGQRFRGGRDVSETAKLHNKNSRGRFTYFADLNSDGLLDVVFSNDVRLDEQNTFGYAMFNVGNRHFEPDYLLAEYSFTMMLHDANGDGHADEFVVQRRNCLPQPFDEWEATKVPKPTEARLAFCQERPSGTAAVYKYSPDLGRMLLISPKYNVSTEGDLEADTAWSMQSGDFDGDQVADLAVLRSGGIGFYLSSKRKPGELPLGDPHKSISWKSDECTGRALRVADLDLDGSLDLLVMCQEYGVHRMYSQVDEEWHLFGGDTGDLNNLTLPLVQDRDLLSTCSGDLSSFRMYVQELCSSYKSQSAMPNTRTYGMSVVDWNNDGFMDVALTHDFGSLILLRNNFAYAGAAENTFIAFKLVGTVSNQYGIGATVLLKARNMGPYGNETLVQLREIYSAQHETDWWGSRDDRIIFGLAENGVAESVTVRWPGRGLQVQAIEDPQLLAEHTGSMLKVMTITEPEGVEVVDSGTPATELRAKARTPVART